MTNEHDLGSTPIWRAGSAIVILPWIATMVLCASSLRFGGERIVPERMLPGIDLRTSIQREQAALRGEITATHGEIDTYAGLGARDRHEQ